MEQNDSDKMRQAGRDFAERYFDVTGPDADFSNAIPGVGLGVKGAKYAKDIFSNASKWGRDRSMMREISNDAYNSSPFVKWASDKAYDAELALGKGVKYVEDKVSPFSKKIGTKSGELYDAAKKKGTEIAIEGRARAKEARDEVFKRATLLERKGSQALSEFKETASQKFNQYKANGEEFIKEKVNPFVNETKEKLVGGYNKAKDLVKNGWNKVKEYGNKGKDIFVRGAKRIGQGANKVWNAVKTVGGLAAAGTAGYLASKLFGNKDGEDEQGEHSNDNHFENDSDEMDGDVGLLAHNGNGNISQQIDPVGTADTSKKTSAMASGGSGLSGLNGHSNDPMDRAVDILTKIFITLKQTQAITEAIDSKVSRISNYMSSKDIESDLESASKKADMYMGGSSGGHGRSSGVSILPSGSRGDRDTKDKKPSWWKKILGAGAAIGVFAGSSMANARAVTPGYEEEQGDLFSRMKNGVKDLFGGEFGNTEGINKDAPNKEQALQFFVANGWSKDQAAGIVGNLLGESSLNPKAVGDGGKAFGIAQWHQDRQDLFKKVFKKDIKESTFLEQLEFVQYELEHNEKKAGDALKNSKSYEEATRVFEQKYERSALGLKGGVQKSRVDNAKGLMSWMNKNPDNLSVAKNTDKNLSVAKNESGYTLNELSAAREIAMQHIKPNQVIKEKDTLQPILIGQVPKAQPQPIPQNTPSGGYNGLPKVRNDDPMILSMQYQNLRIV